VQVAAFSISVKIVDIVLLLPIAANDLSVVSEIVKAEVKTGNAAAATATILENFIFKDTDISGELGA